MRRIPDGVFDAVVSDPPYGLEFMGKEWDHGIPGIPFWKEGLRVLKPGGYAILFGGTRTYHRLACAVEDAGFEVRDCLMWLYGSGFPKHKACLKPAYEPILLCRRPGPKVLPLGIDECRVPIADGDGWDVPQRAIVPSTFDVGRQHSRADERATPHAAGRYPANVLHDGGEEVLGAFAAFGESRSRVGSAVRSNGVLKYGGTNGRPSHGTASRETTGEGYDDTGTAARFFYCAKASKSDRGEGNTHPTVKPVSLMQWLARLVCPKGGLVLDPFAGSGTTGVACVKENRRCVLIEKSPEYAEIARSRVDKAVRVKRQRPDLGVA